MQENSKSVNFAMMAGEKEQVMGLQELLIMAVLLIKLQSIKRKINNVIEFLFLMSSRKDLYFLLFEYVR